VTPFAAASSALKRGRDRYDNLVHDMLVAWDILMGIAVGLWVLLRALHLHALQALRTEAAAAALAEANDVWADTRRSAWEERRLLLVDRRRSFVEVAKPLEPSLLCLWCLLHQHLSYRLRFARATREHALQALRARLTAALQTLHTGRATCGASLCWRFGRRAPSQCTCCLAIVAQSCLWCTRRGASFVPA
jgi:hypothetical protein